MSVDVAIANECFPKKQTKQPYETNKDHWIVELQNQHGRIRQDMGTSRLLCRRVARSCPQLLEADPLGTHGDSVVFRGALVARCPSSLYSDRTRIADDDRNQEVSLDR